MKSEDCDFHCISETHATTVEMSVFRDDATWRWDCGSPVTDATKWHGVATLARKSAVLDTSQLAFPAHSDAQHFWSLGRLMAVQIWLGTGRWSIIVYLLYGSPQSQPERERLAAAVLGDAAERGPIPVFIGGDWNMRTSDSPTLQRAF